jgi:hypothetical protein
VGQRFEGASWLVPPLALGRLHGRDPTLGPLLRPPGAAAGAQLGAGARVRCEQQPRQPRDQRAGLG